MSLRGIGWDHPRCLGPWDDVPELARSQPGRVALPLAPADAICSYVTLLANRGADVPSTEHRFAEALDGIAALTVPSELARHGHRDAFDWNPPALLDSLSETDEIGYVPLTFGFQLAAGEALNALLRRAAKPERLYEAVEVLYRERSS